MGNNMSTPSLRGSSFALATVVTGYWLHKAMKPPRPLNLKDSHDSKVYNKSHLQLAFSGVLAYRTILLGLSGLSAVTALAGSSVSNVFGELAKYPGQVNPTFLDWNQTSALVIPFVALNAAIRLHAFNELGVNFTFDLHDPNRLITTGMYKYVQHPSYTTAILSAIGGTMWFVRADGPVGAFLPPAVYEIVKKYQAPFYAAISFFMVAGIAKRVSDEEKMLKNKFGKEWEQWHKRTPRFVPFLF